MGIITSIVLVQCRTGDEQCSGNWMTHEHSHTKFIEANLLLVTVFIRIMSVCQ